MQSHHGWLSVLLLSSALVVAAILAGGGFALVWKADTGQTAGSRDATSRGDGPGPSGAGTSLGANSASEATALDACQERWAQELRVQFAAERTLQQWRLHIDAMNQLVAGKITLAQASAYWSATRRGAIHRIDRFLRLDAQFRHQPDRCQPVPATGPIRECADAADAVERSLDAARVAATTWRRHIHQMEMLRTGQISPAQATRMWLMMWKMGQHETVRYDRRAGDALAYHCA
jgi:hypothetical protein